MDSFNFLQNFPLETHKLNLKVPPYMIKKEQPSLYGVLICP